MTTEFRKRIQEMSLSALEAVEGYINNRGVEKGRADVALKVVNTETKLQQEDRRKEQFVVQSTFWAARMLQDPRQRAVYVMESLPDKQGHLRKFLAPPARKLSAPKDERQKDEQPKSE